jgi:hypothetical protein
MRAPLRHLSLLLLALGWASGCVVEGMLDPSGGGRLELRYRLVSVANLEQMKARLASPEVTLTEASMTPDKRATFALAFRDVRALETVPAFATTRIALADEADGSRTLTVTLTGQPATLPPPYVDYLGRELRVTFTVPGDVVRSNATTVTGRSVTWVRPIVDVQHDAGTTFSVTFRPAAGS